MPTKDSQRERALAADESLRARHERDFKSNPDRYLARLTVKAIAGYAVLPLTLIFSLVTGLLSLWLATISPDWFWRIVCTLWSATYLFETVKVARAVEFRLPAPDGIRLAPRDAPRLFALVEDVRAAAGAPPIDAIYIDKSLNAAACQRPKSVLLDRWSNELILGLPLTQTLSDDELKSVIAHELGHFGGAHGKKMMLVARAKHVLRQAETCLNDVHLFAVNPVRWIENTMVPGLVAQAGVIHRQQEYEADAFEAHICGAAVAGDALKRLAVAHAYHRNLWSKFWSSGVDNMTKPNVLPYKAFSIHLSHAVAWQEARDVLQAALKEETASHDTHPSLQERLMAIGASSLMPGPVRQSAQTLLEPALNRIIADFDRDWWQQNKSHWFNSKRRLSAIAALDTITRTPFEPQPI